MRNPRARIDVVEGCCLLEGDLSARRRLRETAVAADGASGRVRRENPEQTLDLWRGLVEGEWSLIERFESDGRRFLVAARNPPEVVPLLALSDRERQVVLYAALGYSNKLIGYVLGLGASTVATHLQRAMNKLRIRHRVELVELLSFAGSEAVFP